ncbi:methionine--tRNA ligase [Patescibacteria group bacterium]|nr:MAG: methionine--tRNA ligase [Patescibacteria group bacterium]
MNKFYITTAIDYVNAKPHVGHAAEKVQADVLARYHREVLGEDTYFLSGSDENSLKNVQGAKKAGKTVEDFVAENVGYFQDLKKQLNLSYDYFIRTTEPRHFAGAQKMWKLMDEAGDLYKKEYKGFYCVGCEEFKMEKDLVEGKCPEHNCEPEVVEEENYFFRLSRYQDKLKKLIESDAIQILPSFRKKEMLSFIDQGLEDFSVSRSRKRAENWGVPVPGDEEQIMYVWVDALSNYITALDYATEGDLYKKYWLENENRVHVIGKGILRFHCIYWPAMLLSAGLPVPTKVFSHEYLTIDNKKISKTLGNVIEPQEIVDKFGMDGARYLLLASLPYRSDGDISWEKMTEKYNADLANGLGNLVSRIVKLSENLDITYTDQELLEALIKNNEAEIKHSLDEFDIERALVLLMLRVREANKFIEENKPWELAKNDAAKFAEVMKKLNLDLAAIARLLVPFLPDAANKIKKVLADKEAIILFQRIK